jgi:hypothetical protein
MWCVVSLAIGTKESLTQARGASTNDAYVETIDFVFLVLLRTYVGDGQEVIGGLGGLNMSVSAGVGCIVSRSILFAVLLAGYVRVPRE